MAATDSFVKRLEATLAAAATLLGPLFGCSSPSPDKLRSRMMRVSPWFITYSRPLAPPGGMSLLAAGKGGCMLQVSQPPFGIDLPERPEIGAYFWKCPPAEAEKLKTLIAPAMAEASRSRERVVPLGTRFLSFGLGKSADSVEDRSVRITRPLPPAIQAFDDAVIALARAAQDHPYMILRASARTGTATLEPSGELSVTLNLINAGVIPLTIRNPAVGEQQTVSLMLKDSEGEFHDINPKSGELVASSGTEAALEAESAQFVTLEPGELLSLSIKVRRHTYLRRGSYEVIARYTSEKAGIPATRRVDGFVQTEAGTVTVGGKAAPERRREGR